MPIPLPSPGSENLQPPTPDEVEFIARYSIKDVEQEHHEQATFQKVDGKWYFVDGVVAGPGTYRREEPKVGRNDPCPSVTIHWRSSGPSVNFN